MCTVKLQGDHTILKLQGGHIILKLQGDHTIYKIQGDLDTCSGRSDKTSIASEVISKISAASEHSAAE